MAVRWMLRVGVVVRVGPLINRSESRIGGPLMMRRTALVAALAALVAVPLAGCTKPTTTSQADGAASPSASPSSSPSATPAGLLAAAATKTAGTSFAFALVGEEPDDGFDGAYDAKSEMSSVGFSDGDGGKLEMVVAADEMYMTFAMPGAGEVIYRIKIAKLPLENGWCILADPVGPLTLLSSATGVTSTGPGSFSGTLDLAKLKSGSTAGSKKFVDSMRENAGKTSKPIAFTATVDGQGYLTKLAVVFPEADEGKDFPYTVTLSKFGESVTVAKPTGTIADAPPSMYQQ